MIKARWWGGVGMRLTFPALDARIKRLALQAQDVREYTQTLPPPLFLHTVDDQLLDGGRA